MESEQIEQICWLCLGPASQIGQEASLVAAAVVWVGSSLSTCQQLDSRSSSFAECLSAFSAVCPHPSLFLHFLVVQHVALFTSHCGVCVRVCVWIDCFWSTINVCYCVCVCTCVFQ